jgi:hypothetical protein
VGAAIIKRRSTGDMP